MRIGVPKEIKVHEYRVGLTPSSVAELTGAGHRVVVEASAGQGIGFSDAAYRAAGAEIGTLQQAFAADLIVKVKEPQLVECARLRKGQVLSRFGVTERQRRINAAPAFQKHQDPERDSPLSFGDPGPFRLNSLTTRPSSFGTRCA